MIEALCLYLGLLCAPTDIPPTPQPPALGAPGAVALKMASAPMTLPALRRPSGFPQECPAQPPAGMVTHFVAAARRHAGPSACELAKQAKAESAFRPDAVSPAGAIGVAQFLPPTARELGIDPWDTRESIFGMARYVRWCRERWTAGLGGRTDRDIRALGLATYNYGLGNMRRHQERHGWILFDDALPELPRETRDYVAKIEG